MKHILGLLISLIALSLSNVSAQELNSYQEASFEDVRTINEGRDIVMGNGVFCDDGGPSGLIGNQEFITSLHASSYELLIYFTEIDLPLGSELWIFDGKSITDSILFIARSGMKIPNITGKHITLWYKPSPLKNYNAAKGWIAEVQNVSVSTRNGIKVTYPESDCPYAIPLCNNASVMTGLEQYVDLGNIDDDDGTCYSGTGTGGSVWYSFSPSSDGPLDFTITPTGGADYDFVLWDITNGCESGVRQQISCNFSLYTGTTGLHSTNCNESFGGGGNCTSNDCSTDSKQSDCNRFNRRVNVLTTHRYAICVNFYSGSNHGFNMSFQNEAGSVSIGDNTPPYVLNSYTGSCTAPTTIHITFNEWVDCSTIQGTDFSLPGYTFTVVNTNCTSGRTLSVDLSVSPALPSGNYNIAVSGITDMCGNVMNSVYPIIIGTAVTAEAGTANVVCKTPGFLGIGWNYSPSSQTISGSSPSGGGTQYLWSNGMNTQSITVSPTSTTTYTVTVSNSGCYGTDVVTVYVESATASAGADQTICSGFPATLTGSGGGTYQWYSGPTWLGNGTAVPGGTTQTITVNPAVTTTYRVVVTSPNGCTGYDDITVNVGSGAFSASASPAAICPGGSATLSLPAAITSYDWSGGPSNTPWVVSPATTTTYTVSSTTAGCTGTTNITVYVNNLPAATATTSPAVVCPGDVMTLQSTPTASTTTLTEDFEGATNILTLVNGSNNKWYQGTATACNGTKALFIGTNSSTYNYINYQLISGVAATNFAYMDVPITGYSAANLSFNWRCLGKATDYLTVWSVPTSYTPVAGTPITATAGNELLGGPYWNSPASCNSTSLNLLPGTGTTKRIVFQWTNVGAPMFSGNSSAPPPASIDDIVITQTTDYAYNWASSPAGFASTNQSPSTTATANTTYTVTVSGAGGCSSTSSVFIGTCSSTVTANAGADVSVCPGTTVTLGGSPAASSGTPPYSYLWSPSTGLSSATDPNPTVTVSSTTTYVLSVTDNGGFSDTDTIIVTVYNAPTADLGLPVTICPGNSATLDAGSGFTSYIWSTAETSQSITVSTAATYSVTVTDGNGCTATDNVVVSVGSCIVADAGADISVCPGGSTVIGGTPAVSSGIPPYAYSWTPTAGLSDPAIANPTASPAVTTTYVLTVIDNIGTIDTDTVVVTVYNAPAIELGLPVSLCTGDSHVLDAGSGFVSYNWSTTETTQSITVNASGTYSVTVTDANGCTNFDNVVVTVSPAPVADISGDSVICAGESVTLTASGGTSYLWSNGPSTAANSVSPATTTTYTVTVGVGSCTDVATYTVTVNPNPTVDLGSPVSLCDGDSVTIDAGTGFVAYNWSTSETTQTIEVFSSASYSVTVTDANGCTATDEVLVTFNSMPVAVITGDTGACAGDPIILTASGGATYLWSNGAGTGSITVYPSGSTTYSVTVSNGSCSDVESHYVEIYPAPTIDAGEDTTIVYGSTIQLQATGGSIYNWTPPTYLSSTSIADPFCSPEETIVYYVSATDSNGCSASDEVTVAIRYDCGKVFVPSAFAPNGNGYNDKLRVLGGCITTFSFSVFDRWGNKIFETTNPDEGWDGTRDGAPMDGGIYYYIYSGTRIDGTSMMGQGDVTLIR